MKKYLMLIISVIVIALLILTQIEWVRQLIIRDKERVELELKQTLQSIVSFCLSKEVSDRQNQLSFDLIPVDPSQIPPNAIIRGSFDTGEYSPDKNLANFMVGVFSEDLLEENKIPLEPIDSLFRQEFSRYSEITSYSMTFLKEDSVTRTLQSGEVVNVNVKSRGENVTVDIPLGESGTYRYRAHVTFKPAVYLQRLRSTAILSALSVILISLLVLYQLVQIKRKSDELDSHKKAVRGIIHDLKSPLAYVYTMLGIFEKKELEADKKVMFQSSKLRVKYLSEQIEILLSTIKNKKNIFQIKLENYPFTRRCKEIIKELEVIYPDKEIIYSFEPETEVTLQADPVYFDGCVRNLLDNAIKYSGNIPMIHISTKTERNNVIIAFYDSGKGIEKNKQKKVFREFYRSETGSSLKNHGVGLSFVKQVVNAHKGKLNLESSPGMGSKFTIVLPQ
ncbi:HAMP domain-containing sensor histidine kinase [Proteiniphilum sp.]|uniref:sensor histidine kinase n=1 Tax=Proteiniphilum sp. TaxID=1926877 RepID=UPI003320C6F2